jgi:hypothetical protein
LVPNPTWTSLSLWDIEALEQNPPSFGARNQPVLRKIESMNADDLVSYNGIEMRRDYAESLEAAQSATHYRVTPELVPRIAFGQEAYPMVTAGDGLCPCCSTMRGRLHEPLCEREQCPVCKQQVMSCDCDLFTDDAIPRPMNRGD